MALNFPRNHRIAGIPVTSLKKSLTSFLRTGDPGKFIGQRSAYPHIADGAAALALAQHLRWIDIEAGELTDLGQAILNSTSTARTPIAKAEAKLAKLLYHIEAINANPARLVTITEIYLFGSLMRGDPTVGDIDLDITTERGPSYANDFPAYLTAAQSIQDQYREQAGYETPTKQIGAAIRYLIFGARKDPLLSGARIDHSQLQLIDAPCQRIYTSATGIDRAAPILDRHPDYNEADAEDGKLTRYTDHPPITMPVPRPLDARWLTLYNQNGYIPEGDFTPEPADNMFLASLRQASVPFETLRLFTGSEQLPRNHWSGTRISDQTLDPIDRVVIVSQSGRDGVAFTAERSITISEDAIHYTAHFSNLLTSSTRRASPHLLDAICIAASMMIAADLHALIQQQLSTAKPLPVKPTITDVIDTDLALAQTITADTQDALVHLSRHSITN